MFYKRASFFFGARRHQKLAAVAAGWVIVVDGDVGRAVDVVTNNPFRLLTFAAVVYGSMRSTG